MLTTVILFDFDRLKGEEGGITEFKDLDKIDERRRLDLRIIEMKDIIQSLQALYGGEVALVDIKVIDQLGNSLAINQEPLALIVSYWLTHREIEYVKEVDDRLVVII